LPVGAQPTESQAPMTFAELLLLAFAVAAGWFFWTGLKAREAANVAIRRACRSSALLFLDDTVALASMRPVRDDDGRLALQRTYRFDFSANGTDRRRGAVTLLGSVVQAIDLPDGAAGPAIDGGDTRPTRS
jgi:hypothetical protein